MIYAITFFTSLLAGVIQSVSGFGAGIIIMCILPYFFGILSSSAICNFISVFLCILLVFRYRHNVRKEYLIWPAIFFLFGATLSIYFSTQLDLSFLKVILGLFLVILAIYFSLLSKRVKIQANILSMFLCGFLSGILDGLFSIGGPLMVLFFLTLTESKEEYLATISTFLLITCVYNLFLRVFWGIFTFELLPYALFGTFGVFIGFVFGSKIVDKINGEILKKMTYILISISGIITLVSSI